MHGDKAIHTYREARQFDASAIPLDANGNGRVDAGEGVVIQRCGEQYLIEATNDYLEASTWHGKELLLLNKTFLPHSVRIEKGDTVAAVKAKLTSLSGIGAIAHHIKPTRSFETFRALGDIMPEALPRVAANRELNALYVAGGSHVAPLAAFFSLIDRGLIDEGRLTVTEIDETTAKSLKFWLGYLHRKNVLDQLTAPEPVPETKSYEYPIEITYKGKKIHILVLVGMSGEAYYRKQDLKKADAVILHDANAGIQGEADLLSGILKDQAEMGLEQAVILENETDLFGGMDGTNDLTFLNHFKLPGSYGCRGNWEAEFSDYRSALLLKGNQPLLKGLAPEQIDLAVRFATLGTQRAWYTRTMSSYPAGGNQQCQRSFKPDETEPGLKPFTPEELNALAKLIEGWMELPDETLPQSRKDQILLHLLYYFYTEHLAAANNAEPWALFHRQNAPIFVRLRATYDQHVHKKLQPADRAKLSAFFNGKPPLPDKHHQTETALNRIVRQFYVKLNQAD